MQNNQQPMTPPAQSPAQGDQIDVEPIIAKVRAGVPSNMQAIYDKAVLSGMRIMFSKASHQMTLDALNQPGPMATRISNGIIQLMYLLWTQSNKTLPPQIIVPVTLTLSLRAFQFLQESHDPEATKDVLGEAASEAVQGIMDRFGATQDKLPSLVKAAGAAGSQPAPAAPAPGPAAAPQPPAGMLGAAMKGQ